MLRIESLSATYDGAPVLRDIDLEVPAGELLCVLGPSGGGKSTLLRVIAGLEEPSAGRVSFDGRDLAGVPAHVECPTTALADRLKDAAPANDFPHEDFSAAVDARFQGERTTACAGVIERAN